MKGGRPAVFCSQRCRYRAARRRRTVTGLRTWAEEAGRRGDNKTALRLQQRANAIEEMPYDEPEGQLITDVIESLPAWIPE
jgi:hypothetical protein